MGKLGPRLSSRKKAKRWVKGQSSSSNPQTRKYRDQAGSRFFQENLGSTGLTTGNLQKHDTLQGLDPPERIDIDEDATSQTSTFKTFNTFASDYTNCSNMSFNRFLTHFQSSSLIHKEMLAILAAVTETIKQNGGTESATEYYAALMTTLEQVDTDEAIAATLSLLGMGLKTVPKTVLKNQFNMATQTFFQVLKKYAAGENFLILRHGIGCLSLFLRAQDTAMWSNSLTHQVLEGILAFTVHSKPKVRKAAQHAVCALLKNSDLMKAENNPPVNHPAAAIVANFCLQQFESAGQPGRITTTLHILTLLKDIIHQLPKSHVKLICEGLLALMNLNDPHVKSWCFQIFHSLFVTRPAEAILPSKRNAQIINALYEYQPSPGDIHLISAWLAVMQEGHCNLIANSVYLCAENLPKIIETTTKLWQSEKTEVVTAASHAIKTLLQVCLPPMCENKAVARKYSSTLTKVFQTIREGMSVQYNSAWHHVLHLMAVLFQTAGTVCTVELSPILIELATLRDSYKFTYNTEVEYAVGAAVRAMGPEIVLANIPLQTSADGVDLRRSWLLPVLKDCTSNASLAYFTNSLLPLALVCEKKSAEAKAKNDGIAAHSYELLTSQIWALLPSFCNDATDIASSFKSIAKILGSVISQRKDLRMSVMASLRKLISKSVENNRTNDIAELAKYSKNYLPLLFNLYTTQPKGSDEEGQRLAAFDTLKIYLKITSSALTGELFDTALVKLKDPQSDEYLKQSVFDLIRVLVQFTDATRLQQLYDTCEAVLMATNHAKEQKKAYRFLEDITGSTSEVCKCYVEKHRDDIEKSLIAATVTVCRTSRGSRLRCVANLVKCCEKLEITEFLKVLVPEIVECIKDLNEKCRSTAYELLNDIADKFLSNSKLLDEYIEMLTAGLAGTPNHVSATLLALASLTYKYNGSVGVQRIQEILEHTCSLITGPTREIVLSALSFIKVYLTAFPTLIVGPNLQKIIHALVGMTEDCKRHFRQKVRDLLVKCVRKFGIETISGYVPESDEMMHKRLKNIRKIEARKQNAREMKKSKANDVEDDEFSANRRPKSIEEILADSDEDFDNNEMDQDDGNKKKSKKQSTWITEGADDIVDFTDPSAAKKITATKPGQSSATLAKVKSNHGFKSAADGRLIIKDSDNSDDEDEDKKKKKNKLPFLGNDDDDDYDDDDDKSIISMKTVKRKRKLSGSTDAASVTTSKSTYRPGGSGIHRPVKASKIEKAPGAEYRSKKAHGDVKKKNKHEPYAYMPLTRAALNKRKKLKNTGKFKNIISGARKGAEIRSKNKRRGK